MATEEEPRSSGEPPDGTALSSSIARTRGILVCRLFNGRSDWSHGSHVRFFGREGMKSQRCSAFLEPAIRGAIEDPELRALLADDDVLPETN